MTTFYKRNGWNNTKNNALFYLNTANNVKFKIDGQTYGCEFYNYEASFKSRKQVEALFDTSMDMISPYGIVELCEVMKGTTYEQKSTINNDNEGIFDFSSLNIDSKVLRKMMDGEIQYDAE